MFSPAIKHVSFSHTFIQSFKTIKKHATMSKPLLKKINIRTPIVNYSQVLEAIQRKIVNHTYNWWTKIRVHSSNTLTSFHRLLFFLWRLIRSLKFFQVGFYTPDITSIFCNRTIRRKLPRCSNVEQRLTKPGVSILKGCRQHIKNLKNKQHTDLKHETIKW